MKISTVAAAAFALALIPTMSISASADDAASTAISSQGDQEKGKRLFNRCKACHNLTGTGRSRMGPNLDGLFGRNVGSYEGYKYSQAMTEADFVWTEEKLDAWLAAPRTFMPGNKMAFAGLRKEQDRKDLLAYLRTATVAAE
ncbi:MAG: cytochrome c family protein [Alphaproteobacteria bacterium]|nr:cytochrome c family protein [Alphaproteobacteria bacterium]